MIKNLTGLSFKALLAALIQLSIGAPSVLAQVNAFNTVVFGNKIPRYWVDPNAGLPTRTTTNDFSAVVPNITGAKVIVMSPCGDTFVTAAGNTATLWSISSGTQLLAMQHDGPINWVAFSRDGSYIVTAGGTWARTWSARGEFLKQFDLQAQVRELVISNDGCMLAFVTDRDYQFWDARQGLNRLKREYDGARPYLVLSPDASQAVILDGQIATICLTSNGQILGNIRPPAAVRAVMYSPDSARLLVGTSQWAYLWDAKKFAPISDVQFGGGYR